ncbi:MAG: MltA domain-containing protein [Xanthobacteraceae bacterium]|nr:MltA domain-containing protein [Xanthobacteraceae bacterium]
MSRRLRIISQSAAVVTIALLAALPLAARDVDPLQAPDTQLEPIEWSDVDGWADDDHAAAFGTFRVSCNPFLARRAAADSRPIHQALRAVCQRAASAGALANDKAKAREFFEKNFQPVRIAKLGEKTGLLTGYYEPIVDGSRFPSPEFSAPLYRRPGDMLVNGKVAPKTSLPNRGNIGRFNAKKQVEPYFDRGAIENGALDGQRLEIAWLKDHWEAMTIQIQGSARVRLEDGTMLRINYDAHNGHSYTAVGRILIERGLVPREEMSMDRISQWMAKNPDQAKEVRGTNKSFVFFRITGLNVDAEPAGAQGVPLTPGRSIAVDRIHVYGTPFFIDAELPIEGARTKDRFRRLMVSQDTGSAIIGPARADLYFGAGKEAGAIAGRIRQQGRFVMLLPRELDMIEAGRAMPLPKPKPQIPPEDDKQAKAKGDKSKADPRAKAKAEGKDKAAPAKQPEAKGKAKPKQSS